MKKTISFTKGPSINDVTSEGEGGGDPQKVTRGDKGRDPILGRGDITPKIDRMTIDLIFMFNFTIF